MKLSPRRVLVAWSLKWKDAGRQWYYLDRNKKAVVALKILIVIMQIR